VLDFQCVLCVVFFLIIVCSMCAFMSFVCFFSNFSVLCMFILNVVCFRLLFFPIIVSQCVIYLFCELYASTNYSVLIPIILYSMCCFSNFEVLCVLFCLIIVYSMCAMLVLSIVCSLSCLLCSVLVVFEI